MLDTEGKELGEATTSAIFPLSRAAPDEAKLEIWPRTELRWEEGPILIKKSTVPGNFGAPDNECRQTMISEARWFHFLRHPMPTPFKPSTASGTRLALGLTLVACASSPQAAPSNTQDGAATAQPAALETGTAPGKHGAGLVLNCAAWSTHTDGPYRYNNNQWGPR